LEKLSASKGNAITRANWDNRWLMLRAIGRRVRREPASLQNWNTFRNFPASR